MTWRTPEKTRILTGAEADLVRASLDYMVEWLLLDMDEVDQRWEFGVSVFDELQPQAKLALLAKSAGHC